MDINNSKFTNYNPNLEVITTMDTQIFNEQIPVTNPATCYNTYNSLQAYQRPSSSTSMSIPISTFLGHDNMEKQQQEAEEEEQEEELGAMKEMMYKIAAMQPVDIDPATIRKPKRRNVRISDDPQSIAARHRRERISEKMRILQRLVPGGTKMDTASVLDEAIHYVKFLKRQIRLLQSSNTENAPCIGHWQPPE